MDLTENTFRRYEACGLSCKKNPYCLRVFVLRDIIPDIGDEEKNINMKDVVSINYD